MGLRVTTPRPLEKNDTQHCMTGDAEDGQGAGYAFSSFFYGQPTLFAQALGTFFLQLLFANPYGGGVAFREGWVLGGVDVLVTGLILVMLGRSPSPSSTYVDQLSWHLW